MALDETLGALLVGSWAASLLFGLVTSETYKYFSLFPDDSWGRKGLVIVTLALSVAALIGDYANTYLPTVTYWGNTLAMEHTYWPLPLYSITNTSLSIIVDCYLIYRFYSLSKNIWATIFLYALILLGIAGYLIGFIPLVRGASSISDRDNSKLGATIYFISIAVCDILIAAGLIWKLRSMKSNFPHTNTFIKRIMVGAIQTGSTTSICSISLLIAFLDNPESNVATIFIFLFAPLYTLTLLFNFNIRRTANLSGSAKTSESRGNTNILMDGIQVHRTAVVTMDPTNSDPERRRRDQASGLKQDSDIESLGAHKVQLQP
ncbi:hypothetical protein DFH08DRAFT_152371 [Mycena albidolilacea]|uniref:DUF6534 domain-containing protein n=1 Tax=Mycena albidolilacea TaxID=1033008 RepID=A0AAD7A2F9_9AGAR|nr:hypothetical protein DFH08DRAFT_152371 [Mycena albidolilacea]